ncbi:MAG: type IV secretory system conjugative DNA transfer family protein [Xanthomonadaceae bacterium]|nr:type IV secretory system conjugative DNA transfer family protein [Xanthomonadaceae bacterium]
MNLEALWSTLQVIIAIVVVLLLIRAVSVWRGRRAMQAVLDSAHASSAVAHGTADWSRNAYPGVGSGSLFLGAANGSAMYYDGDQHLITVAPTRTGKGTCHIIPNLLTYQGSMVVNDIKGENFKESSQQRLKFGQVFRFAPFAEDTDGFNPLDFVRRGTPAAFDDAMLVADMLIVPGSNDDEGNHWKEAAKNLLAGLIGYVTEREPIATRNLQRVRELLTLDQKSFLAFVQEAMADPAGPPYVVRAANMLLQKADRERSGVISTAQAQTSIWDSEPLARATRISTFKVEELRDQVATLYIIVPPEHLSTYKSVLRVVLGLALSSMTRKPPERSERPPLTFLFDEFPSLGYMQPVVDAMAYLAGYGCRLWLFAQDLGQIREIYGDNTTSLLANCGARAFFGVADYETAEYVSKMAGQKTVLTSTRSLKTSRVLFWDDIWGVESQNLQYIGVPLIAPDEVMRIPVRGDQQRQIVFLQGQAPVLALKIPYHVVDAWAAAAVRAPVSVQLDQAPMPPSTASEPPRQPEGAAAADAVAKAKAYGAAAAKKAKPWASAAASAAKTGAAHLGEKISLVTQQGAAYIKEGNKRKGQGMAKNYETIDEIKASSEQTRENMVDFARFVRETEGNIRLCEAEIAALAPNDPRRAVFEETRSGLERSLASNRRMVEVGRILLDGGEAIVESIEDGA